MASAAIEIRPVRGLAAAMTMRRIRNEVRGSMTRDTSWIGPLRQARWWWSVLRRPEHPLIAWLLRSEGRAVGYGILRKEAGRWWVTGAIVQEARGVGYGKVLFNFLTAAAVVAGGESWLEVRKDNGPARRLYESIGYRAVGEGRDSIMMVYHPPEQGRRRRTEEAGAYA